MMNDIVPNNGSLIIGGDLVICNHITPRPNSQLHDMMVAGAQQIQQMQQMAMLNAASMVQNIKMQRLEAENEALRRTLIEGHQAAIAGDNSKPAFQLEDKSNDKIFKTNSADVVDVVPVTVTEAQPKKKLKSMSDMYDELMMEES